MQVTVNDEHLHAVWFAGSEPVATASGRGWPQVDVRRLYVFVAELLLDGGDELCNQGLELGYVGLKLGYVGLSPATSALSSPTLPSWESSALLRLDLTLHMVLVWDRWSRL